MFLFCIIFVSIASTLSASSFYYEKEDPYSYDFYEEALYFDSASDRNMAGKGSFQKRQTGEEISSDGWSLPWRYEHEDFGNLLFVFKIFRPYLSLFQTKMNSSEP